MPSDQSLRRAGNWPYDGHYPCSSSRCNREQSPKSHLRPPRGRPAENSAPSPISAPTPSRITVAGNNRKGNARDSPNASTKTIGNAQISCSRTNAVTVVIISAGARKSPYCLDITQGNGCGFCRGLLLSARYLSPARYQYCHNESEYFQCGIQEIRLLPE